MFSWSCCFSLRSSLPLSIQTRRRSRRSSGWGSLSPGPFNAEAAVGFLSWVPNTGSQPTVPLGEMQLCLEIRNNPESSGRLLMNLKGLASSCQGESRLGICYSPRLLESEALFVATGGEAGPCPVLTHHLARSCFLKLATQYLSS